MNQLGFIKTDDIFEFCRSLEDQFHGESSGVDIAISFYEQPIVYRREHSAVLFNPKWSPKIYLFYSGKRGVTSECVNKVKALKTTKPDLFLSADKLMQDSVDSCVKVLSEPETKLSLSQLAEALRLGQECYEQWDLVPFEVVKSIDKLKSYGAVQCKLTGSGGGGYILSLWGKEPPQEILGQMVELIF